ncbi:hypothetical protein O3P69_002084 [Scylla paramamosain]|uniref:Major facilitator superfamily (MFS) profile domain-containing protein n=1 Tax=Scylla paramamosain TaxID=85552 RepID=A0AAW0V7W9_SCYPA
MGGTFGKSGSWVVDHTMDDIQLTPFGRDKMAHGSVITGFEDTESPTYEDGKELTETPLEKRGRKRSHWIAYTTVFIMSIGFSIVLTSVWPYLKTLNENLEKNALGFVVAANPLGQMLASPLLGLWGNKAGKIRGACLVTVAFFILGNVMYSLLALFEGLGEMATYDAMIVARFIVGMSSANITLCRSYLAQSTTIQERTSSIAILAGAQALGFVIGPAIQTLLIIIIPVEVDTGIWWLKWNEYSAAGWVAAILGLINLVLLMPYIFKEHNIAKKEMAILKQESSKDEILKLPKLDPIGLTGLLFGFFIGIFIYVLIETLAVPFVSDQYAWSDNQAQVVVGVALMVGGLLASVVFPFSGFLSRKFDERKVLLFGGFIPMIMGMLLFLPYPGKQIPLQNCTSTVTSSLTTWESSASPNVNSSWEIVPSDDLLIEDQYVPPSNHFLIYQQLSLTSATAGETDEDCTLGCPAVQKWCEYVPQLPMAQLAVSFLFVMFGYPIEVSISQGLFSKMLGPKPQGVWMGVLTGMGSLGRILGPIFVSYIYTNLGTYWCFGTLSVCMVLAFFVITAIYPRLVPMKIPVSKTQHAYDGPAAITQSNGTELPKESHLV